jgi:hypothetical protein
VRYRSVYPGIDLVYYGNQGRLEYDFSIAPGSNPNKVKLHFGGAQKLMLDSNGNLTIIARNGKIVFHKPVIYQLKSGQRVSESANQREPVEGKFTLLAGNSAGFKLGSYDKSRTLVIDPTLEYSTYLGGSRTDSAAAIAVDSHGNTYVAGAATSMNFPMTTGAFQTKCCGAFVTKLNSAGTALIYSTYLDDGYATGIAIDVSGNAYVVGSAGSGFPVTSGAFQTVSKVRPSSNTAFVTKLGPSGSSLIYSTFLGGSNDDSGSGIAVDAFESAYVTGTTASMDFPITPGAFQSTCCGTFITKLNPAGTGLIYSTYLDNGLSSGIAIDSAGNAYVAGSTYSLYFPVTRGAFQTVNYGGSLGNAFVTKLNSTGTALIYSTFLGGSHTYTASGDTATDIAVDAHGNAFVTGSTTSPNFPVTPGAFQTTLGTKDRFLIPPNAFVTKLNPEGTSLLYSTYLGGSGSGTLHKSQICGCQGDSGNGIAVDDLGNAWVTGYTGSANFPVVPGAFQMANHMASGWGTNAFFVKLSPSGSSLLYSTYVGGSGEPWYNFDGAGGVTNVGGDVATAIALDQSGSPYLAGSTNSFDFPVSDTAFQRHNKVPITSSADTSYPTATNAFVTRFVEAAARTVATITSDNNPGTFAEKVTFTAYVYPARGKGIPTGTIAFSVNDGPPVEVSLDDTGHAAYATSSFSKGKNWIVATYSGDTRYGASITALAETIH